MDTVPRATCLSSALGHQEAIAAPSARPHKGTLHLRSAERTVAEEAAVFAGEGHALGHTLVDDIDADLGQPVHIGFAGAVIAPFDRIIKQAKTESPSF